MAVLVSETVRHACVECVLAETIFWVLQGGK